MSGSEKYKLEKLKSASDLEALIMLYDGMMERLEQAEKMHQEKKEKECIERIEWVMKAIDGLRCLLNFEPDPGLAHNLYSLYEYIYHQLNVAKAMIRQTSSLLEECRELIGKIRDSWVEAKEKGGDITEKFRISSTSEEKNFLNIEI